MDIPLSFLTNTPPLITQEMLSIIEELETFKNQWQEVEGLTPEKLSSLQKVATIESIASSTRIEGVKLTDEEVERLLSGLEHHSFKNRDEEEVAGYAETMDFLFTHYQEIEPSENHLKQLHTLLLKYSSKDQYHRGEYKTLNNNVEAFGPQGEQLGVIFQTATPFQTPYMMESLLKWHHKIVLTKELPPVIIIGIFIVIFLAIHPFQDGNGRLSRILTTLLLLKAGYSYIPYSSMESLIESSKENYYLALRKTQQSLSEQNLLQHHKPDWNPWLSYFLEILLQQKRVLSGKIGELFLLERTLSPLSLSLVTIIQRRGSATLQQLQEATEANRNTIKAHLKQLVAKKHLLALGKGRGTYYVKKHPSPFS